MSLLYILGLSRQIYALPLQLSLYKYFPKSPAHKGVFKHAIDIQVPDPIAQSSIVYAPASGVLVHAILGNTQWGHTPLYSKFLNFIHVSVGETEFYELAHVSSYNGRILRVGERIQQGEAILTVALNGQITTTNNIPDAHLHMLVGRWLGKGKFTSLRIRWNARVTWKPIPIIS